MSPGRRTQNSTTNAGGSPAPVSSFGGNRNLSKFHLGGVIFGCRNSTIEECLWKQLFGLPAQHFSYVMNIQPGLPLFLFNYSDRTIHGIYEAASSGKMNINPYGWTPAGSAKTPYPAQVQVRLRMHCQPLSEDRFKPIIADNYYNYNHFWFELDHAQTSKLISVLASQPVAHSAPRMTTKQITTGLPSTGTSYQRVMIKPQTLEVEHSALLSQLSDSEDVALSLDEENKPFEAYCDPNVADEEEQHHILLKLQELALNREIPDLPLTSDIDDTTLNKDMNLENNGQSSEPIESKEHNEKAFGSLTEYQSLIAKMVQEVQELKDSKTEQAQRIIFLETRLLEAEGQIQELKDGMMLGSLSDPSAVKADRTVLKPFEGQNLDPNESIFLIGGFDGESWLSSLDLYDPFRDVIKSLRPMNSARSYASVVRLENKLYVLGGGNGYAWYDTVESYCPENDQWTLCPPLKVQKGSLGGVTIDNKLFALGGGNGIECFSEAEMLDLDVGRWIHTRSMLQRRFALAAVELNGVVYATGGYDGIDYLNSAERFDIREHSWTRIPSMNAKRGCHSLVTLNEKLYALGGFDGSSMVSSVEVYDPRFESWMTVEPMKNSRGYGAAAVVNESIYMIGGVKFGDTILNTVEVFKEGCGWQEKTSRVLKKRSFLSAVV